MASMKRTLKLAEPAAPKKKREQRGRHRKEWETRTDEFAGLIQSSKKGPEFSYCVACKTDIKVAASGFYDVRRHFSTDGHIEAVHKAKQFKPISEHFSAKIKDPSPDLCTRAEILFAQFVAEHNLPATVADHFTSLIKEMCPDSKIAKEFSCRRTKTTMIVKHCLAPAYTNPVISKCKTQPFSLMIDESNDRNATKRLVILVRLFDGESTKTRLLDLPELTSGKAASIFEVIDSFFKKNEIPWENCVGFGSDNCNTMIGRKDSVLSRLKGQNPNIFNVGCICHLSSLCIKSGVKLLPFKVDDFLVDIFYFFQHSHKRLQDFKEFQDFTETDQERILKHCPTRWLSLGKVVKRVLNQYDALKSYFTSHDDVEKPGKVKTISNRLNDPMTELVLHFLNFIIPHLDAFNTIFQGEKCMIGDIIPEMKRILRLLLVKYVERKHIGAVKDKLWEIEHTKRDYQHTNDRLDVGLCVKKILQDDDRISPSIQQIFFDSVRNFFEAVVTKMITKFPFEDSILEELVVLDRKKQVDYMHVINLTQAFNVQLDEEKLKEEWDDYQFMMMERELEEMDKIDTDKYWADILKEKTALNQIMQIVKGHFHMLER
ncbi:zinc finger BED domain-containing protein 5-like [Stigmatopora nigra]